MSTIVNNQVAVRVNRELPILIRKVDYWIAGGRQGPCTKYEATPVELAPNQAPLVLDPYVPKHDKDSGVSTKKGRKRKKKRDYTSGPSVMHDTIYRHERKYYVLGQPILQLESLHNEVGDLRSLHDIIYRIENRLLGMQAPAYPDFVAKVPVGLGFVDYKPADVLFLRFDVLFGMFHMKRLTPSLVHLFALSEAYQSMKEQEFIPTTTIADSYYMCESKLHTMDGHLAAKECI